MEKLPSPTQLTRPEITDSHRERLAFAAIDANIPWRTLGMTIFHSGQLPELITLGWMIKHQFGDAIVQQLMEGTEAEQLVQDIVFECGFDMPRRLTTCASAEEHRAKTVKRLESLEKGVKHNIIIPFTMPLEFASLVAQLPTNVRHTIVWPREAVIDLKPPPHVSVFEMRCPRSPEISIPVARYNVPLSVIRRIATQSLSGAEVFAGVMSVVAAEMLGSKFARVAQGNQIILERPKLAHQLIKQLFVELMGPQVSKTLEPPPVDKGGAEPAYPEPPRPDPNKS